MSKLKKKRECVSLVFLHITFHHHSSAKYAPVHLYLLFETYQRLHEESVIRLGLTGQANNDRLL